MNVSPNFFNFTGISNANFSRLFVTWLTNLLKTFFFRYSCAQISLANGFDIASTLSLRTEAQKKTLLYIDFLVWMQSVSEWAA